MKDREFLRRLGLQGKRVLLAIDPAQISTISGSHRDAVLEGLAMTGALKYKLLPEARFVQELATLIRDKLIDGAKPDRLKLESAIKDALEFTKERNPGEAYSAVLAFAESGGRAARPGPSLMRLHHSVWDYIKALQTNQTWDRYTPNGFTKHFVSTMAPRVMAKGELAGIFGKCPATLEGVPAATNARP